MLLCRLTPQEVAALFDASPRAGALRVRSVTRASPITFEFSGWIELLIIAALLLGKSVKTDGKDVTVELRGLLIEVIQRLRKLFSGGGGTPVGYGPRERRIKLTKSQHAELMREVKGQGGFQSVLKSLQHRVNGTTRELTLSPSDIDYILKHGSQPKKGGFQGRIRKIFDTHFNWP